MTTSQPLICLMGPTASGKTAVAIELAKHFPVEIISVDSAMVYRGMDIGTAKPSEAIRKAIPHHLIDIADPATPYSAGQFRDDALRAIAEIRSRERIPLLVGGTMLYFRVLREGIATLPKADLTLRKTLQRRLKEQGAESLHAELMRVDPKAARRIHVSDSQRLLRALEVYLLTGTPISASQMASTTSLADEEILYIGLLPADRALLHTRIATRFDEMLAHGFLQEVQTLYARSDLSADLPALRSVGYRQMWAYLSELMTYQEMRDKAIIATRQLAKRQLTWLRSWRGLQAITTDDVEVAIAQTKALLTHHGIK